MPFSSFFFSLFSSSRVLPHPSISKIAHASAATLAPACASVAALSHTPVAVLTLAQLRHRCPHLARRRWRPRLGSAAAPRALATGVLSLLCGTSRSGRFCSSATCRLAPLRCCSSTTHSLPGGANRVFIW
jgi:hypothetical protein